MKFHLTKSMLAISETVSKDATRPHITGMLIDSENGKLRFVATDGHMLAMLDSTQKYKNQTGSSGGVVIPPEVIEALKVAFKGRNPNPIEVEIDCRKLNVETNAGTMTYFLEEDFSPYRQVLPKPNREIELTKPFGLSPDLVTRAMKIVKAAKPIGSNVTKWEFADEMSPVRITSEVEEGTLTILVMPMRLEDSESLKRAKEREAKFKKATGRK